MKPNDDSFATATAWQQGPNYVIISDMLKIFKPGRTQLSGFETLEDSFDFC